MMDAYAWKESNPVLHFCGKEPKDENWYTTKEVLSTMMHSGTQYYVDSLPITATSLSHH